MSIITKAYNFARMKHGNTLDDNGEDYVDAHLLQVAQIVAILTKDKEMVAAALLHDTVEDTNTTPIEIFNEFGPRIASLVIEVTHEGKKDNYGYYFPYLFTRDGYLLKFADRASNLSRMQAWDESRRQHYMRKSKFWKDGHDKPARSRTTKN